MEQQIPERYIYVSFNDEKAMLVRPDIIIRNI
jgi:hypothetical protein